MEGETEGRRRSCVQRGLAAKHAIFERREVSLVVDVDFVCGLGC